jgi:hypothetical protein
VVLQQRIFSRYAVDDDVDAMVGEEEPAGQRRYLALARVIDAHGARGAAGGPDHRCGLIDCLDDHLVCVKEGRRAGLVLSVPASLAIGRLVVSIERIPAERNRGPYEPARPRESLPAQ